MKIYTKTGDDGETGTFGGPRVSKDAPRIEAYGTVDELNAVLGIVRSAGVPTDIDVLLGRIQNELFDVGAELATPDPQAMKLATIGAESIARLEGAIDAFDGALPPLRNFIVPGGTAGAAYLHLARTVCRRAERRVVALSRQSAESAASAAGSFQRIVIYLNRLSDLLFVLSRAANFSAGVKDVPWEKMT